jgi:hypothetical protein
VNAAAIGLIGVIFGALLAGATNLVLDRSRRLAKARVAGRLIAVELSIAEQKLTAAIEAENEPPQITGEQAALEPPGPGEPVVTADATGWWMGDLPMDAWKEHQSKLATDVSPGALEMVARAYALCAVLNDQHDEARASHAGPQGDLADLAKTLALAGGRLADESKIRARMPRQRIARWSPGLAAVIVVIVLAGLALLAPRVTVDSASVTTALQGRLGHGLLVQCNPGDGDWDCTAYPPSWPNHCPAAIAAFLAGRNLTASVRLSLSPPPCIDSQQPAAFTADVDGGTVTAVIVEQSAHVDRVRELAAKLATSSALTRFWRSIFG